MTNSEPPPVIGDAIPAKLQSRGVGPHRMFATCLIGAAVLALFASRDLPGWAERLGDAPLSHRLRTVAGSWDEAMEALGLTRPHEALRAAMQRLLDRSW